MSFLHNGKCCRRGFCLHASHHRESIKIKTIVLLIIWGFTFMALAIGSVSDENTALTEVMV